MGYALIIGGGDGGRYTVELDIGESLRSALVEQFTEQTAEAQAKVAAAQVKLDEKTALLDAATLRYDEATAAYISVLRGESEAESPEAMAEIAKEHDDAQKAFIKARTDHSIALANKNALSFSASHLLKALAGWQAQVLTETRQAWCADLTEDAAGYVATIEIPGESDLILIAPGGRSWNADDGYLRSRALMSPWQVYFNAAILPGWQKFKPTHRWGTITALDEDANTATVALAEARSSAQLLLVNQTGTLQNVPVVYMNCDAAAFDVGDRVVVEFQGQDWEQPRVIGFLDNPRPCHGWELATVTRLVRGLDDFYYLLVTFKSISTPEQFAADIAAATTISLDFRINRGSWRAPVTGPISTGPLGVYWEENQADLSIILLGNTNISNNGRTFSPALIPNSAPTYLRVSLFIGDAGTVDYQPLYSVDSIIEVRLKFDEAVYSNIAFRIGYPPYSVSCDFVIPDGFMTDLSSTPSVNTGQESAIQLEYVRFLDDGT